MHPVLIEIPLPGRSWAVRVRNVYGADFLHSEIVANDPKTLVRAAGRGATESPGQPAAPPEHLEEGP